MNYNIADKLTELRKKQRLSQDELAEKLGISRQAISNWERAESLPDTENLIALSRLYNITIDELINVDKVKRKNDMESIEHLNELEKNNAFGYINSIERKKQINSDNRIVLLSVFLIAFIVAIVCLALVGYFISELLEVLGGYYDHMSEMYVRSEIIGYSIALAFSVIGLIAGVLIGSIFLRKYKKRGQNK
ncbi:MAG: helix-turn-helix domain-containing protein [Firmicutes bacterium]|nr:helix-turn-helix domain-containing protein [Bacillota bacterium]